MKLIAFLAFIFFTAPVPVWLTNFKEAQKAAAENNKLMILNFSGSDWCIPCMRTRKEIFETACFTKFSGSNLVLINADFPRNNKNKLSKEQSDLNEALADKYNAKGIFPLTILISADGKILKEWEGFPGVSPEVFVEQIKKYTDARN